MAPGDDINVIFNKINCFLIVSEAGRIAFEIGGKVVDGHWKTWLQKSSHVVKN